MRSVNFILGNDIAGGRVMPLLEICDKPDFSASDELSEEFPEVFLSVLLRVPKLANLLMQMIYFQLLLKKLCQLRL